MRYFLVGFMGSGKSYWNKRWSEAFQLKSFDLDEEIEKQQGKSIPQIFQDHGEGGFRKIEREVLTQLLKQDHFILSCGGGTPCFFDNMKRMNEAGVTIYLDSTVEELTTRLMPEKTNRPLIQQIADQDLSAFIDQKLKQRLPFYKKAVYHLRVKFLDNSNFERIIKRHG
ncbi:MAG: shikimate kinase [Lacibacter sp.]